MKNVLDIHATNLAKATGVFKTINKGDNNQYTMYLPSQDCGMQLSTQQIREIFGMLDTLMKEFDYVTIHDQEYSKNSYLIMEEELSNIPTTPEARINMPFYFFRGL
jgi:hypothetical protein